MTMYVLDRAVRAQKSGYFNDEMVPVRTKITDKEGVERSITVGRVYSTLRIPIGFPSTLFKPGLFCTMCH